MFITIKNDTFDPFDELPGSKSGTDVVIALVGDSASHQFRQISLSMDEIESTLPLTCFDTRSTTEDLQTILKTIKDAHVVHSHSDMLFVLSELETDKDFNNCLLCVEQLKSYNLPFFVTHEKNRHRPELTQIADKFKHIIYVSDDTVNLFSPVKQLICVYYRPSCVGIDVADVVYIFQPEHKMVSYFIDKTFDDMNDMDNYIPELFKYIDTRKTYKNPYPDFMFFLQVSQDTSLDKIENFVYSVMDNYNGGNNNIVWSFNFNSDSKDNTCTLLLQTIFNGNKSN